MDKGVILLGDAAQAYVQYKYFELYWTTAGAILLCVGAAVGIALLIRYIATH